MALDPRTPVLVGAGQVGAKAELKTPISERPEPADLMAWALEEAAADCEGGGSGRRLLDRVQSLRVILPLSWSYVNPGLLVAARLGIEPAELALSVIGGNEPQAILSQTALAIAAGDIDVAVVVGADCIGSRRAARRHPDRPRLPWTVQSPDTPAPQTLGIAHRPVSEFELEHGLDRPMRVYPLFENALRAAAGASIDEHQVEVSELWARFSEVASGNPHAWSRRPFSAPDIRTVSADNRMISFPYPKRMNANDGVDQGAGLILCSVSAARSAGVPEDRWVFPVSGADAHDHWLLSNRQNMSSSPAMAAVGRRALQLAGAGIDDVDRFDLYSCFPCAVEMAAAALGVRIDDRRSLTVTGGLTFAGGPGNNYVTHSVAAMASKLREEPGSLGMVTGLGWYVTKHSVGLWSTSPPSAGFRHAQPQDEIDALPQRVSAPQHRGDAVIETYTVVHGRHGEPELGVAALLTVDGARTWGTTTDGDDLAGLMEGDWCGRTVRVGDEGRLELR